MSDTAETTAPRKRGRIKGKVYARSNRARVPRKITVQAERRRRKPGSLDRLAQYALDIFTADQLDPAYEYRWITDSSSRLRMVTRLDDYDFVQASEITDFNVESETDSEGGERIRVLTGQKKDGSPEFAYLLKKRKDFCAADREEAMAFRDAMMDGRIFEAEAGFDGESGKDTSNRYIPDVEVQPGLAGRRRPEEAFKRGAV